jgi:hypothetical protein
MSRRASVAPFMRVLGNGAEGPSRISHPVSQTEGRKIMRKTTLAVALLGGLLVGGAAPAAAAPPEREKQSGTVTSLESFTEECTQEQGGGQTCTGIFLSASTDTAGMEFVSLSIETYMRDGEEFTPISSESGFAEGDAELTVNSDLSATLAPTTVTLESYDCTDEDCELSGSREVTVSASGTAIGPVGTSRERGMFKEGKCAYKWSFTPTSADAAGTITLDGVAYDVAGRVSTGDYRSMSRCK